MSSLLNSSINGSASSITDNTGRMFPSSFSAQSGAGSPIFHHSGTIQGLHNMHGSFNLPSMAGSLNSRNSAMNVVPPSGMQHSTGSIPSGRFGSNNIPVALSQISHVGSHGQSGVASRGGMNFVGSPGYSSNSNGVGGSIPGILQTSAGLGNHTTVPGLGVSPTFGNAGSRITSSMGSMIGSGNIGRNISSGGLSVPGLGSRLNLSSNGGSGSLSLQGPNRLMNSGLQQASPQVMSMLGNSYVSGGGPLSQSHNLSSMAMLIDVNSNESSPFGIDDFPVLTSRPGSAGGPQGQIGSMRRQGAGSGPMSQQNQDFSIQKEEFPALPGYKGGDADYGMDLHQKDQLHDNSMSMMQNQPFSNLQMGRSSGFSLGGTYMSQRPQQQQQQQHLPSVSGSGVSFASIHGQDLLHGSDMFTSSNSTYHGQGNVPHDNSLRSLNSLHPISGMASYDQQMQQYQQQNAPEFRLRQMPAVNQLSKDQSTKPVQDKQTTADPFALLGLLSVTSMSDPDRTFLALGVDLMGLGLDLTSSEALYKTFGSPFSVEPVKGDPDFSVPQCYNAMAPLGPTKTHYMKFDTNTLFYIFYSMPKDEAQICAASELCRRGWFYHKELRSWLMKIPKIEPLLKTPTFERGSYFCFDPKIWEKTIKEDFILQYESIESRPMMGQHQISCV